MFALNIHLVFGFADNFVAVEIESDLLSAPLRILSAVS